MRKLFAMLTLLAVVSFVGTNVKGQSQRLVLLEHFTQASCPYCPPWNTNYEALKTSNPGKFVIIRHQVSWPGYDPMNMEYASEVAARVSYYSITGVPDSRTDGTITGQLLQPALTTEYAVVSPFDMSVTHSISADYDSIFIEVIINCTQAVTGALVAQTVIEEEHIAYASAPGTNGEKDFYNVARKMLPNELGTTLATSWTVGQTDTLNFAELLPTYIHDIREIMVVAFVQNNTGKSVKQAACDAPIVQTGDANLDAGISAITNVPVLLCVGNFTPSVTLKNYKNTVLTSATINWQVDNGTIYSQPWTGSLALNATANITLPSVTVLDGSHVFRVFVSEPNGGADFYPVNNTQTKPVTVVTTTTTTPLTEGFQTSFPPTNWIISNPGADDTWEQAGTGGFGNSTKSMALYYYNITSGTDEMILPAFDLSTDTSTILTFSVAYAQYQTEADQLKVNVSVDCGSTWTAEYSKSGSTLSTAPATTSFFIPTAAQWRSESVDLIDYVGEPEVFIKFTGISAYGNNVYVDDINLSQNTSIGVKESSAPEAQVNVYPNPFSGEAFIDLILPNQSNINISVYNVLGDLVYSENPGVLASGNYKFSIDGRSLPAGIYYFNILLNDELFTRKASLVK